MVELLALGQVSVEAHQQGQGQEDLEDLAGSLVQHRQADLVGRRLRLRVGLVGPQRLGIWEAVEEGSTLLILTRSSSTSFPFLSFSPCQL